MTTINDLPEAVKVALEMDRLATEHRCPTCNAAPGKFCVQNSTGDTRPFLGWDGNRASHTSRIDLDYEEDFGLSQEGECLFGLHPEGACPFCQPDEGDVR